MWKRNVCLGKTALGKQTWVAQQAPSTDWAPPPSKQCKHGKAAAYSSVFVSEKTEKLDINPSVQSQAVPKRLVCQVNCCFENSANTQLTGNVKIHAMTPYCPKAMWETRKSTMINLARSRPYRRALLLLHSSHRTPEKSLLKILWLCVLRLTPVLRKCDVCHLNKLKLISI